MMNQNKTISLVYKRILKQTITCGRDNSIYRLKAKYSDLGKIESIILIYFLNTLKSHAIVTLPMFPSVPKLTSKFRSALRP